MDDVLILSSSYYQRPLPLLSPLCLSPFMTPLGTINRFPLLASSSVPRPSKSPTSVRYVRSLCHFHALSYFMLHGPLWPRRVCGGHGAFHDDLPCSVPSSECRVPRRSIKTPHTTRTHAITPQCGFSPPKRTVHLPHLLDVFSAPVTLKLEPIAALRTLADNSIATEWELRYPDLRLFLRRISIRRFGLCFMFER